MDFYAVLGIAVAFGAIVSGNSLEGGELSALIDGPAFIIVVGGTMGAVTLQTPFTALSRALKLTPWILLPPKFESDAEIAVLQQWSRTARRDGLLGLENIADRAQDGFKKKGLELLVDGLDPPNIRRLLEIESDARTNSDLTGAQVFRSMGGYAPTIGILGAVIGLIQVMGNLADPDELGQGIATAFVATIYGVGFANLLFLPIADRLKSLIRTRAQADELVIEGLVAIAEGEHPRNIEIRMRGYLAVT